MIELLVVISIIGVLVGLLLPSVQATRENARSVSCQNNLINLHLAVETYHTAFDAYPAGTITDRLPARMFPDGKDHGWLVQVRPFMPGGFAFAESWSPLHSAYHPKNWDLAKMGPAMLSCPSSPFMHNDDVTPLSYVGIHDGAVAPIDVDSGGFFVANRFLRRRDISDGLSHTLQLGEISVDTTNTFFWIAGNQSTLRSTGTPIQFPSYSGRWWGGGSGETRTDVAYGRFADPIRITYKMLEREWSESESPGAENEDQLNATRAQDALIELNDALSPAATVFNQLKPAYTIPRFGAAASEPMGLGSSHESMVHGVFGDGRVVTINRSMDRTLYSQIGTRNDAVPLEKPLILFP